MQKVFLGVGHGGMDSGAVGLNRIYEKDLNLAIALACCDELERNGVLVLMSRTKDEEDPLAEEIKEANAFNADLAVDIHNNAGGGFGFEAYYGVKDEKSKALAMAIEKEVVAIGQKSRGCKVKLNDEGGDWFGFVRQIKSPAILVECAFVDTKDVETVDEPQEQKAMGAAIARGILRALGIVPKMEQDKSKKWYLKVAHFSTLERVTAAQKTLKEQHNWYSEIKSE